MMGTVYIASNSHAKDIQSLSLGEIASQLDNEGKERLLGRRVAPAIHIIIF
jgi:hypothetical protein